MNLNTRYNDVEIVLSIVFDIFLISNEGMAEMGCDDRVPLLSLLANELFMVNELGDTSRAEETIELAHRHAVDVLIYYQLKKCFSGCSEILREQRTKAFASIMHNDEVMRVQECILSIFNQAGICSAVLKGSSIATYYPHPELRTLGDIDILVADSDELQAKDLLVAAGFRVQDSHDFHSSLFGQGVVVEIHRAVSRFPNTVEGKYASEYMKDAVNHRHFERVQNFEFPVLDCEYQLIALLSHMERHMIDSSIGLRQLCDWAVTIKHYSGCITNDTISTLDKCGLLRFACVLTQVCSKYLKMPNAHWCKHVEEVYVDAMYGDILAAGNLGATNVERAMSNSFVDRSKGNYIALVKSYIVKTNQKARRDFWLTKKLPFFLPFFWLYYPLRWKIRAIKGERENVSFMSSIRMANRRKRLYSWLRIFQDD